MELTIIFYYVSEFCNHFEKEFGTRLLSDGRGLRKRKICLTLTEIMTIAIYFHASGYKTFKGYYLKCHELKSAFPNMPSYNRFIELMQKIVIPLLVFTKSQAGGNCDGVSYVDSFSLEVSHQKRIYSHKVFRGLAQRGKTSMGWFYGFKLHVVINSKGEIIDFEITAGNIADNNESLIEKIFKTIQGKVFGDKGYLLNENLFKKLYFNGIHMITKIRKNMKNILMDMSDKIMLKKRGLVESVGAVLKEDLTVEHSRYRNPITLVINVCSALAAYHFRENKPTIRKNRHLVLYA
jgi:hypothetical protein